MFIAGLGVAAPPQRYTRRECWDALQKSAPFARLAPRSRAILQKVLGGDNGIATRYLALKPISEVFNLTPDTLHARFARHARHAPALAAKAAQRALKDAKCKANEIDAMLISTCTGYLCPASPATPVNGPGCVRTCSRKRKRTKTGQSRPLSKRRT